MWDGIFVSMLWVVSKSVVRNVVNLLKCFNCIFERDILYK